MRIGLRVPGNEGEGAHRERAGDDDARGASYGSSSLRAFSEADAGVAEMSGDMGDALAGDAAETGNRRGAPCSGSGDAQGGSIGAFRTRAGAGAGRLSPSPGAYLDDDEFSPEGSLDIRSLLQPRHDVGAPHGTLPSHLTSREDLERAATLELPHEVVTGRNANDQSGCMRREGPTAAATPSASHHVSELQGLNASAGSSVHAARAAACGPSASGPSWCSQDGRPRRDRSASPWRKILSEVLVGRPSHRQRRSASGSHRSQGHRSSRVSRGPVVEEDEDSDEHEVEATESEDGARSSASPAPAAAAERGSLHSDLGSLQPRDLLPRNSGPLQLGEDVEEPEEEEGEGEEEVLPTAVSAPVFDRNADGMQPGQRAEAGGRGSEMRASVAAGGSGCETHLHGSSNEDGMSQAHQLAGHGNPWDPSVPGEVSGEERRLRRPLKPWYEGARARREEQGQSPVQGGVPERQHGRREGPVPTATVSQGPRWGGSACRPSSSTQQAPGPAPALQAVPAATPPGAGPAAHGSPETPSSLGYGMGPEPVTPSWGLSPSPVVCLQRLSDIVQRASPAAAPQAPTASAVFQRPPLHSVSPAPVTVHLGLRALPLPEGASLGSSLQQRSISVPQWNSPGASLRASAAGDGVQSYRLETAGAQPRSQGDPQGPARSYSHGSRSRSHPESQSQSQSQPEPEQEPEPRSQAQPQAQPQRQPHSWSQSQSQSQSQSRSQSLSQPQSQSLLQSQQSLSHALLQPQPPQSLSQSLLQSHSQSLSQSQSLSLSQSQPDSCSSGGSKRRRVLMGTDVVDLLECPICIEPMAAPIFQCHNGHTLCNSCVRKVDGRCPSCRQPTGSIRNLALEKLAASSVVSCSHEGCSAMLPMRRMEDHEAQCPHRPLPCPAAEDGCAETFASGGLVCQHLMACHGASLTDLSWDPATRSATCDPIVIPPGRRFSLLRLGSQEGSGPASSSSASSPSASRFDHALVLSRPSPKGCTLGVLLDAPGPGGGTGTALGPGAPGWRFSLHVSPSPNDLAKPAACSTLSGRATDLRSACLGTRAPVELTMPLDSGNHMFWIKLHVQGGQPAGAGPSAGCA